MKPTVPFFRTLYNFVRDTRETASVPVGESMTNQSEAADADINTLVRRFGLTGQLPNNIKVPVWGDFTDVPDYREVLDFVRNAGAEFMKLPADLRSKFDNEVGNFVEFCSDPNNEGRMVEMGILKAAPPPAVDSSTEAKPK